MGRGGADIDFDVCATLAKVNNSQNTPALDLALNEGKNPPFPTQTTR
jgi:hypothetical protein